MFFQSMVLMTKGSWQNVHSNNLGCLVEEAGYVNCYSPSLHEDSDSPLPGNPRSRNTLSQEEGTRSGLCKETFSDKRFIFLSLLTLAYSSFSHEKTPNLKRRNKMCKHNA